MLSHGPDAGGSVQGRAEETPNAGPEDRRSLSPTLFETQGSSRCQAGDRSAVELSCSMQFIWTASDDPVRNGHCISWVSLTGAFPAAVLSP